MKDTQDLKRIPKWADHYGVKYITFLRACKRAGLEIGKSGTGSVMLTMEQAEGAMNVIRGGSEAIAYERSRQGFLDTWAAALTTTEDLPTFYETLKVYGVICAARDRETLNIMLNGWRVGDIFLEVAQGLDVDRIEGGPFGGFTAWLQEQGYQSPGWNVI